MANKRPLELAPPWADPNWPDRLPDARTLRLVYGDFADELVVKLDDAIHEEIVVPISTPGRDYAGLLVDIDSGAVFGVHVYPLAAYAVERHPAWLAATTPNPAPSVATLIVRDIKNLFDRYGIEPGDEQD
jgi:hypothetical protein